jgi:hypothetical protein
MIEVRKFSIIYSLTVLVCKVVCKTPIPKSLSPLGKGTLKAFLIGEGWVNEYNLTNQYI